MKESGSSESEAGGMRMAEGGGRTALRQRNEVQVSCSHSSR